MKDPYFYLDKIPKQFIDLFSFNIQDFYNEYTKSVKHSLSYQSINGYQWYNVPISKHLKVSMDNNILKIEFRSGTFKLSQSLYLNGIIHTMIL